MNDGLSALEREFAALYSPIGRPSIPPEKLLRAMLLQAFYSIRSERLLMERLKYDLLFRWFAFQHELKLHNSDEALTHLRSRNLSGTSTLRFTVGSSESA